jgi:hypothetical protein
LHGDIFALTEGDSACCDSACCSPPAAPHNLANTGCRCAVSPLSCHVTSAATMRPALNPHP